MRIPDDKRAAILTDIQSGRTPKQVAHDHGVSASTVRRIAADTPADDQPDEPSEPSFDAKAARRQLVADLYADAQRFRERSWAPYTQVFAGSEGVDYVYLDLPPLRDQEAGYKALIASVTLAMRMEQADNGNGVDDAKSLIGSLAAGLQAAYGQMNDEAPGDQP